MRKVITEEYGVISPPSCRRREGGFTMIELATVVSILLIVSAIAIPYFTSAQQAYKMSGAARMVASMLAETKIRAASNFSLARLNCTDMNGITGARASCQIELCTASLTCTLEDSAQPLPANVTFSFGSISTVPTPDSTQSSPTETLQVYFNSRGIPVNVSGSSHVPTGGYAIYLKDKGNTATNQTYAIVVTLAGRTSIFQYQNSWIAQ